MTKQRTSKSDHDDILFDAIHALRNEIGELRDAVHELREEIQWGNRNCGGYVPSHFRMDESDAPEPSPRLSALIPQEPPTDDRQTDLPQQQERLW